MIGRTVRLEEGLDGVLLRSGGVIILRHNFPWLELNALGPFWAVGNVICPLKDFMVSKDCWLGRAECLTFVTEKSYPDESLISYACVRRAPMTHHTPCKWKNVRRVRPRNSNRR